MGNDGGAVTIMDGRRGCLVMALWVSLLGFLIYSAYLFVIGGNWLEPLKDVGIGLIVLITPFIVGSLIN